MADVQLCCVPRRCGLCRIYFAKGETLVAVKANGEISEAFDCEVPVDFKGDTFYIICDSAPTKYCYHDNKAVGCHLVCVKLLPATSPLTFMAAFAYKFEPSKATERARAKRLQHLLSQNLKTSVYLPQELRLNVAKHLLCEYAASLATALPFHKQESGSEPTAPIITTHTDSVLCYDVLVRKIRFEGIEYITSLANRHRLLGKDKAAWEKITPLNVNGEASAIYLCEDEWGFRDLIFGHAYEPPMFDESPDVWWKTLPLTDPKALLSAISDCTKVKEIRIADDVQRISSNNVVSWAIPQPISVRMRKYNVYQELAVHLPVPKMAIFRYNDTEITGYSICCNPAPVAIHAHVDGEEDIPVYEPRPESSVWIYMPLAASEFVTEMWLRSYGPSNTKAALLFKTNQGRTWLMGTWLPNNAAIATWTFLERSDGTPGRFFIDCRSRGIASLAFESLGEPVAQGVPFFPEPISFHTQKRRRDIPCFSSAPLEGIESIAVCRYPLQGQLGIIGLLIHYLDGHAETVGQVRLDSLEEPIAMDDFPGFSLGFAFTTSLHPYVKDIVFGTPPEDTDCKWVEMAWHGTLEWWFTSFDCQVCYNGKISPTKP